MTQPHATLTRILRRAADRVKRINETTRDAIRDAIAAGLDLGEGAAALGARIASAAILDPYRGELIARTETMYAWNSSAIESYRDFDVEMVEPQDGDEDEECQARLARGAVTLDEAMDDEDHPNGTLAWSPVVDYAAIREEAAAVAGKATEIDGLTAVIRSLAAPPIVNVPAPIVTIEAAPAPIVNVNVPEFAAALRELKAAITPKPTRKRVERDEKGRITVIHEEPI